MFVRACVGGERKEREHTVVFFDIGGNSFLFVSGLALVLIRLRLDFLNILLVRIDDPVTLGHFHSQQFQLAIETRFSPLGVFYLGLAIRNLLRQFAHGSLRLNL